MSISKVCLDKYLSIKSSVMPCFKGVEGESEPCSQEEIGLNTAKTHLFVINVNIETLTVY